MWTMLAFAALAADQPFEKSTLDKSFWSEGVAVADFNKDGKPDLFAGDVWYEQTAAAPKLAWKRHEVRAPKPRMPDLRKNGGDPNGSPYDGAKGYSNSFACFAHDFNGDGWMDVVTAGFPGEEWYWAENPQGKPGPWKQHLAGRSICNESPQWVELVPGKGRGMVLGVQPAAVMAFVKPGQDSAAPWDETAFSARMPEYTGRYYHGLGTGDLNGDGRLDVVIPHGWWEQPAALSGKPWTFRKAELKPPGHTPPQPAKEQMTMADMHIDDLNEDGLPDVIGSCAHKYGIWWFENLGPKDNPKFKGHVIREDISETHAMCYADLDGDGKKEIVTGKRFYSHMRSEPGALDPAVVIAIRVEKSKAGPKFTSRVLDSDSGVGTQFQIVDVDGDGKPDVALANKKGVHVLRNTH